MPTFVVDSSVIISCAANCLVWLFDELKKKGIKFIVPKGVEQEVIYSGLSSMKFRYEAIRVMRHFITESFIVFDDEHLKPFTSQLLNYANTTFRSKNQNVRILQETDAQVAALAKKINADGILTDERTLRLLIESPESLKGFMQHKLNTELELNQESLLCFKREVGDIPVFRSVELVALAFELGIFDEIIKTTKIYDKNSAKNTIEGVLYALKFAGCGVSFEEINEYTNILLKKKKKNL